MTHSDPQQFLEKFFGSGNAIRWSKYVASSTTDSIRVSLEPWIVRFQKQQSPFCLPRVDTSSQQTSWYVLCTDSRQARSVRETLQSFIGPTYAYFNGELANLSPDDPIEQFCLQSFGPLVFRLPVLDSKDRSKVNSLLRTMMEFRDRDNSRSIGVVKPIGRLLRDLEMAILASNEESATQIYTEIRSRGRLSATNLAFLHVRILAEFDRWAEILLLPNLSDLLSVRRPKRVSEQIASAVYRHSFLKFEESSEPIAAIDAFGSNGIRFQNLVRSTDGFTSTDAQKFAVLAAIAGDPPNRDLAERLIENDISEQDRPWCHSLLLQINEAKPSNAVIEAIGTYNLADVRYDEGNFDEAFRLYLQQTPTYPYVCRVLETAIEIDDISSARSAIEYLESASEEIRGRVLGRRVCINQIEIFSGILGRADTCEPKALDSLAKWFQGVDECSNNSSNLNHVLGYALRNWIASVEFDPTETARLLRQSRTGPAADTIRNAVPLFINAFLVEIEPRREHKSIYSALIELLVYDETIGSDDLSAVEQLLESILTIAPSLETGNNDFVFAVDVTKHLWGTIAAPRYLNWALSMIDLLIDTGTQQHTSLQPVFVAITESVRQWVRRVSDDQWSLLQLLSDDLGISGLIADVRPQATEEQTVEQESIRNALRGKSIAVYSLTERIARRFGQLAEQAFDGIKIHYVHDKSLTDRMKTLARSADIFIVNTWDAKHAATIGIKQSRSAEKLTIEPLGKSASSLLSSLVVSLGAIS
jgi:hypothetical protein